MLYDGESYQITFEIDELTRDLFRLFFSFCFQTGEGGIILLPGVSLDESFTDDGDDDWLKSLEGPPSPCDVMFINDNILIDGKSSLTQKSRIRQKVSLFRHSNNKF